ncbi:polysaccharide biosynthesis/export family protein [Lichenicoccus roseus]|uniref:polysaccharide biosynthesis/export family protein n=1 Tax=Lichenicoccus roseus TaxID=2683649 RepID=UPI001F106F4F|nr:polysaccharide biosynthesis/export family protein [Lichenicoccus roseus]
MRRNIFFAGPATIALAGTLALSGCSGGADLPPLPDQASSAYSLGPGDEVRVITVGEDSLSGDFHVSDAGNVAMPMLGAIKAAGMTTTQLGDEIEAEAKNRSILRDPQVSVEVTNYRPIFVLGEVAKPGQYPYQPGMTVLTAVTVAGGFTYRAVEDYASIVRSNGKTSVEGKVQRQSFVKPGDVVTIYERHF